MLPLFAFFTLQLLVALAFRAVRPPPAPASSCATASTPLLVAATIKDDDDSGGYGEHGLVYVYDLQLVFNQDLLGLCNAAAFIVPFYANGVVGVAAARHQEP